MTQENSIGSGVPRSDLLSRREAAAYLGVAEQTLAVWASTKRVHIPFIKLGKLVKYRKSDLDQFITKNLRGA